MMASVQNPQGPMAAGMPPQLPMNLKPEMIQNAWRKYQLMKESGVQPNDPEYLKLQNILRVVSQHSNYQKQRQAQGQSQGQGQGQPGPQPPQHQLQRQVNGASPSANTVVNGVNGRPAQPSNNAGISQLDGPSSTPVGTPGIANNAQATNSSPSGQRTIATTGVPFTPEQLATLRNQIYAFKLLSRNLSVPLPVQQKIFPSQKPSTPQDSGHATTQALQPTVKETRPETIEEVKEPEPEPAKSYYHTFQSPYDLIPVTISYADHSIRAKRLRIPSIIPSGVDVDQVREDRERILYNRILARKEELGKLPANLGVWNTGKSIAPTGQDSLKLKALIEYKSLCLLPKQRLLRQQVGQDLYQFDNLAMTANRSAHRRMKKQSVREARITEKLEKQQRDARETKEKNKRNEYLQSIINHGTEIKNVGGQIKARSMKLGKMMQTHHQHMEREEQKRVERTAKQRLQALKANDEETYLKLLGQAKDTRITHLLEQTNGFLKQLAASVKQQQRNSLTQYGEPEDYEDEDDEDDVDDDDEEKASKVDYYAVAHRIKEDVTAQPSILVGGQLKEYQIKGLQWMISLYNNNLNGILADEMGLGKTIQTISLITYLIEKKKQTGPFLVIVPLSTLTNWKHEFEKWAPSVNFICYRGTPNARKIEQQRMRQTNFQVLLTTYEYIIKDRPFLAKVKWIHMIVDEGHRMKNANSKLSFNLTTYYTTRYRLILTGTPLQNNLPELWALLNFVLPKIFKSVKSFDEWFNTPFANTGGQDKMELTEEEQLLVIRRLHKVLRPFLLRRLKKDVEKDLPDKQERVVKCRFSSLQAKLYKQLVTNNKLMVSDGKGGKVGMRGLSNILMQLRKLCNHPFVFEQVEDLVNPMKNTNDLIWRTAGKFELLDRVLPKFQVTGHRVLIFFQMTQIMNIMEDFLRLRGITYLRLDGSTKSDERADLLQQFNAPDSPYFCFLLSTRAGGLGLNLQTADTVIIYDSDWNPHQDLQAQDRAHRIGQKNEVRILRLISSNSVEEKILERAQFKLDMDGKVIQAGKFDNKSTNEEREQLLRTLLETAESAENIAEDEEMDDDILNEIMARSEDELTLFQKMDIDRNRNCNYGLPNQLPRLMSEAELPDIYLNEAEPIEEVEEYAGRGARERKITKYDDGLTEEQWLQAVDDDNDTIEAAIARKNNSLEKRKTNKEKRVKKAGGVESSPDPTDSESPPPKKRGRKPGSQKRKAEEPVDDTPASKRKRGAGGSKSKQTDSLSSGQRAALQKALKHLVSHISGLEVEVPASPDDSDGESIRIQIIGPFNKLVTKAEYPDYFELIHNPMAMDIIKKKVKGEEYSSLREFHDDVKLMCDNCKLYNDDGSDIFLSAVDIERACDQEIKKQFDAYPDLADLDDLGSSILDTAAASSVGTPLATSAAPSTIGGGGGGGGTKLKLKFNGNRDTTVTTTNGTDSAMVSDDE